MLVFQLCPILNACTKNMVLVLCGLHETTATTKKHRKHDGWRVLGRRTHNNVTLYWNEVARKSSAGAFWCFVEQTNPQQVARKRTVLVLFGPDETTAITKKHQNTESTGGGGGWLGRRTHNTGGEHTTLWHCAETNVLEKQFLCILVLRRTDEPTANCTKKQSAGALWNRRNHSNTEKAPKAWNARRVRGPARRIHNTVTLCWNIFARKSKVLCFWCFVEQTNPQQFERKSKALVLLCALLDKRNHNYKEKAQNSTKSTRGGGTGVAFLLTFTGHT